MKTLSYVSGNLLFDSSPVLDKEAVTWLTVKSGDEIIVEKQIGLDVNSIAIFKYDTFEIKDLEIESGNSYELSAHISNDGTHDISPGDFITCKPLQIRSGFEQVDLQLVKVITKS